ncbi:MAG: large subunit of alpha-aminoadipate reductase [Bogoriella megaspora]|nr:MAG: large subunit of alpha-aminoadipate reductase [Bogoriella megaspora]
MLSHFPPTPAQLLVNPSPVMNGIINGEQPPVLPDPTQDLYWADYRGAIHEIFAANALNHPDRLCVAETASSTTPRREFSYRVINQASNIVAHHLVQNGIQRGEVVMVYAYRGVDLVVAVMGVLKAGATFSVIDPAYPDDRQIVYLDVAKPRALVVIEKASQEAGELGAKVRSYIKDNLQLRTEIPGLILRDDGSIAGGVVNGSDCFDAEQSMKEDLPGVLVGPDSTPTLSFTSGSEGRPKGVKGRHFSLAYYFPWMAETFKLSENDRFTMLSGIAHDPIQRDIFTPLFLGAHLLVPAKEDIQHERLAEWMKKHGATVTHLTPAMGQILVGGALATFPSLHHAFFVGDILIKRDCRRLQELAPNCYIVNMYGTTETQRAVSYYEIPSSRAKPSYLDSLGDVIPAGKGMKDVQLLVVNREDPTKLCQVGEIGEIYVRAGGLAEGYLGQDDLNSKKFVRNWFVDSQKWIQEDEARTTNYEPWRREPGLWFGPRDRLYRSGDLGRYMKSGNVECTGRADNQVKIRGFRIELGEIDSHLSSNILVRENVTLLRRDKFEEQQLVSYIVPDMVQWRKYVEEKGLKDDPTDESMSGMLKRFRYLQDHVRDTLKAKLQAQAIPSVIVPLLRMPLNPNGKIDKPALPFPDASELRLSTRRPSQIMGRLTPTEKATAGIWAECLKSIPVNTIAPEDHFDELGGHSLVGQHVLRKVRAKWPGIDVSLKAISQNPTLRAFSSEIDRAQDPIGLRLDAEDPSAEEHEQEEDYAGDAEQLCKSLPASNNFGKPDWIGKDLTVFLTGATGFLGSYILRDLLNRTSTVSKVIAHVRSSSIEAGFVRVMQTCKAYGIWQDAWKSRIEVVLGDLSKPKLGLQNHDQERIRSEADLVIHCGARVHWLQPYSALKSANVLSTIAAIDLCAGAKPKRFCFVSSTSVLDSQHFVSQSQNGYPVSEADDLQGSRRGLATGYGQSKWASEHLVREAGKRGLEGCVVRPGYVTGDPITGTSITDDFLVRMLKGCVQLHARPNISNTINMVPVDHVARVVTASVLHPPVMPLGVAQVNSHPRLSFKQFLSALETFGYEVPGLEYPQWSKELERYVAESEKDGKEDHALFPLYHMVTSDLPGATIAPDMDDANATKALRADTDDTGEDRSAGAAVTTETIGVYLAYLIELGFVPPPTKASGKLPEVTISKEQREMLGRLEGRGKLGI